ncbi:MAG: Flp family type IVb pilin [Acidobacteriota bacterium]|nr:Flp family type IVb pilin [Acidobacteriota bacterium]
MKRLNGLLIGMQIWKDNRGQDLIEYALMAGFIAVAAGALMPNVATAITGIFTKVTSVLTAS